MDEELKVGLTEKEWPFVQAAVDRAWALQAGLDSPYEKTMDAIAHKLAERIKTAKEIQRWYREEK